MPESTRAARPTSKSDRTGIVCWLLGAALGAAVSGGCTSTHPALTSEAASAANTDLYQVGPLRVLLRPQPEVEFMCRLHVQQQTAPTGRILGCYVPREKAIISTPDAHVLLHEFKHYFEGSFHD